MYSEGKRSWVKHLDFTVIDLICLELSLIFAYFWRFRGGWLFDTDIYERLAVIVLLIDIVVVFFVEPYKGILRRNKYQEFRATLTSAIVNFGGVLVYMYAVKQSVLYSRQLLFMFLGMSVVSMYICRVLWKRVIRYRKLQDKAKALMTVVAESANVERCLREIAVNKYTNYKVTGVVVVDQPMKGQEIHGIPVVANADDFLDYVRANVVDEVFIDGNTRESSESLASALVELGCTVHVSLLHSKLLVPNRQLDNYGNYVVLTSSMKIATNRQLFVKRVMDIAGSIVGLFLVAIAFVIFAPIIKRQSPGPIFYKQVRVGKNGRRFNLYKFR